MSLLDLRWRKKKPATVPAPPLEPPPSGSVTSIRVTDERDGEIPNRGHSYHSQVYNRGEDVWFAFCGNADGHPRFFKIEGTAITRLGPLLPFVTTGEGMYWDASGWIYVCDGPRLLRVNPFTGQQTIALDISQTHPGCDLWQSHSSEDGRTHSATVRQIVTDGKYPNIGTIVQKDGAQQFYGAEGVLDESHLTSDGSHLLIEESDGNLIVDLSSWGERWITNAEGALSHVDCGPDYVVGEDDQAGACTYLDLRTLERRLLFPTWGMGHVSVRAGKCLLSDAEKLSMVALDGSGVTSLAPHGMVSDGTYETQVFGNLSPDGSVAAYVSNVAGRFDLYVLRVP
jgi:hypothetical protein